MAHLVPTHAVISGFGELAPTGRRIRSMEWLAEGFMLLIVAVPAAAIAVVRNTGNLPAVAVKALHLAAVLLVFSMLA
jgi:hypothetical protein